MAAGRRHQKGYKFGLVALTVAGLYSAYHGYIYPEDILAILIGGVLGMLIDPDVRDQHNITTRGERRFWNVPYVGPILGYCFEVYWYPLARWIPHRSFLSHLPVFATAIAWLWLTVPPCLVFFYANGLNMMTSFLDWYTRLYQPWMVLTFLAWSFQDFIHLAQDGFKITWQVFGTSSFSKSAASGD